MLLDLLDLPESEHDPGDVRDKADEILSRPEYHHGKSIMQRINEWIGDRLDDILHTLSFGGAMPQFVAWIILGVLLAGVAAFIVWAVRAGGWGRATGADREDAVVLSSSEDHRSPQEWLAEAVRHEEEGRWREGLLCRYRSLVAEMVRLEVIAELVGRTAGEYVRDVRNRRSDVAPTFSAATDLFEEVWYGGEESGPEERDRFAGLAESTLAAVTAGQGDRDRSTTAPREFQETPA
ncbi:MAG TPA: DUF4129 domain-containing protein [Acidimicrobiales bacterium]|jgi:hypothetical protein